MVYYGNHKGLFNKLCLNKHWFTMEGRTWLQGSIKKLRVQIPKGPKFHMT